MTRNIRRLLANAKARDVRTRRALLKQASYTREALDWGGGGGSIDANADPDVDDYERPTDATPRAWRPIRRTEWVRNARDYQCARCHAMVAEGDSMTVTTYRDAGTLVTERTCAQDCGRLAPEVDWKSQLGFGR